ncbi:hypothetical protein LTR95_000645 [Oleoguttula sp. CCFEE 5521]
MASKTTRPGNKHWSLSQQVRMKSPLRTLSPSSETTSALHNSRIRDGLMTRHKCQIYRNIEGLVGSIDSPTLPTQLVQDLGIIIINFCEVWDYDQSLTLLSLPATELARSLSINLPSLQQVEVTIVSPERPPQHALDAFSNALIEGTAANIDVTTYWMEENVYGAINGEYSQLSHRART